MTTRPFLTALFSVFALFSLPLAAADVESFHQSDDTSDTRIDHTEWDRILAAYLSRTEDNVNLFDYAGVSAADKAALKAYIASLEAVDPTSLNRNEAFAYWANLYNAVTIDVVLENYPVKSILRIRSGLRPGPWKRKLVTINGEELSLDNIEHDIMRKYLRDPRIHYAVNCASYGCPNLAEKAFTGDNLEEMLDAGARAYINHPRGITIEDGRVTASSIYKWFQEDFGGTEAGVIEHMKPYAEPALKAQLETISDIDRFKYDWALNQAGK
jgi:hypothetical protein